MYLQVWNSDLVRLCDWIPVRLSPSANPPTVAQPMSRFSTKHRCKFLQRWAFPIPSGQ